MKSDILAAKGARNPMSCEHPGATLRIDLALADEHGGITVKLVCPCGKFSMTKQTQGHCKTESTRPVNYGLPLDVAIRPSQA